MHPAESRAGTASSCTASRAPCGGAAADRIGRGPRSLAQQPCVGFQVALDRRLRRERGGDVTPGGQPALAPCIVLEQAMEAPGEVVVLHVLPELHSKAVGLAQG